ERVPAGPRHARIGAARGEREQDAEGWTGLHGGPPWRASRSSPGPSELDGGRGTRTPDIQQAPYRAVRRRRRAGRRGLRLAREGGDSKLPHALRLAWRQTQRLPCGGRIGEQRRAEGGERASLAGAQGALPRGRPERPQRAAAGRSEQESRFFSCRRL